MVESSFVTHALDLLAPLGPVRARAMMGGHMLYCGELAVALVYDDRLYLKTDASTRESFAAAGGQAFVYPRRGKQVELSFWTPPEAALDDSDWMLPWARLALEAARRVKRPARRAR